MASPSFNYAENVRRETEAGFSRIELTLPRQPHQTTDVLSANAVYHTQRRIACIKFRSARQLRVQVANEAVYGGNQLLPFDLNRIFKLETELRFGLDRDITIAGKRSARRARACSGTCTDCRAFAATC